jgi:hypothetical protein
MKCSWVVHGALKHLRSGLNTNLDPHTTHADGPRFLQGAVSQNAVSAA